MLILPSIKIVDLCLFLEKHKTLAIGDLHIGYEEALNDQGILIPRLNFKETMKRLGYVLKKAKPKRIVLLGDVKHEFGRISRQEWKDTSNLLSMLVENAEVIVLKGNHDKLLGPVARNKGISIKDHLFLDGILFCHGDRLLDSSALKNVSTIIIGHEHPAISIRDGLRVEKYKCFLLGKYRRKELVVLPSFNFVTEGTDILQEKLMSPFLKDISDFKVFVAVDKAYDFGKVKTLGRFKKQAFW